MQKCGQPIYVEDVRNNLMSVRSAADISACMHTAVSRCCWMQGSFEEWNKEMEFSNPLGFPGYEEKVQAAQEKNRLNEAIVTRKL